MSRPASDAVAMSVSTRKGKITIIEGSTSIKFLYTIEPWVLRCQCQCQYQSNRMVCKHLQWYLVKHFGLKPHYLRILSVPSVKDWCQSNSPTADTLNRYCEQYLRSDTDGHGCGICLSALGAGSLSQCICCNELFHTACSVRWGKGCPKCRAVAPLVPI